MMSPEIDPQQLSAFVDGELDVLRMGEIESRMQHDEGLRREVQELRQLRQLVRGLADYHVAPDAFHQRIASLGLAPATATATASARVVVSTGTMPYWLDWRPRGVVCCVGVGGCGRGCGLDAEPDPLAIWGGRSAGPGSGGKTRALNAG